MSGPPFGGWPPPQPPPVTSVFGRIGAVVALLGDYTSSKITNLSAVAGATVTVAINNLLAVVQALTSTSIANVSAVAGAKVTDALNALNLGKGRRNPIWDPPTVAGPYDEEFDTDVLASGGVWTIATTALMTPMIRDGAIDLSQSIASNHYRSSAIGGTLYVQLRQNEEVFMWKTLAVAPTSQLLWFAGVGFQTESNATASNPRCSLQFTKNNAGIPSFADRVFVRTASSADRYECLAVTGGATISNVATGTIPLLPIEGLALRINHASAAAANCSAFGFQDKGSMNAILNANAQQFNAANQKVGFNLLANTTNPPVSGANATIWELHFLRTVDLNAGGWLAQA